MEDFELLQSYALKKAEDSFRSLTERYVNLVYSAAVRQTGNPEAAKDVTQSVFLILAGKAGAISRKTVLSGWLLRTTRFAAANARRLEHRRQYYEQQAMDSYIQSAEIGVDWQRIAPLLDEAMDGLGEKDRTAVALRFFDQMPLKRVAERLGVSEDGAQKRVSRALHKLQAFFSRHGKKVSVGAMTSALAANCVQAAPASLANCVCGAVFVPGALTGSFAAVVTHATFRAIAQARRRWFAVRAGSAAILLGLAVLVAFKSGASSTRATVPAATPVVVTPTAKPTALHAKTVPAAVTLPVKVAELMLRVVDDQTAVPVTNATLWLVSIIDSSQRITNTFTTDADGAARLTYSPVALKYWNHRIEIFRDGYVPKYLSWSESQQDRMEEIPSEYTVRVEPAVTIGGLVQDERGAPVRDARVVFSVSGPISSRSRERSTMMGNYHSETTGADGKWSCNHVPARFGMIQFKPVHPEFQEKTWMTDSPETAAYVNPNRIPQADFLAGRALMQLKPGLTIAGIVTDETGQPVSAARVTQNFDFSRPERSLLTEPDGSFRFRNGRPAKLTLTVEAATLAPVVTNMELIAGLDNLRVSLPAGRTLRGRVQDDAEQPIAGATIEAASPTSDSRTFFQWRAKTDADGFFAWDAAPAVQEYAIYASGYETRSRIRLTADATEQKVRLTKKSSPTAVKITGQVVDAATKQPPVSSRVQIWETGKDPAFSNFTTVPEDAAADGTFRLKTSSGTVRYILEVQAEGYWPERLTNQVTGEREVNLRIELVKAPLAAGVVLTPAGEPAAGATLIVCGHNESAHMMQEGKLLTDSRGSGIASAVTDAQGHFRLPNKHAPEVVVVAHAQGFFEMPFSQVTSNTAITLQPWGRIEGTAQANGKPLAQETIRLNGMPRRMDSSPRVSVFLSATTDTDGHFAFMAIPAGEWKVQRELNKTLEGKTGIRIPAFSHGVPVMVRAGENVTVALGGSGRTVVGRAVAPDSIGADLWVENSVALILKIPSDDPPHAPNSDTAIIQRQLQREYRAMFAADGSFRIDDVPAGNYSVEVNLVSSPKPYEGNPGNFAAIASLKSDVTIPASNSSDEAHVNLGVLQLSTVPVAATPIAPGSGTGVIEK